MHEFLHFYLFIIFPEVYSAGPEARSAGLQTLPRGYADPRVTRLHTRLHWGCSQARGSALPPKAWQAPC